MTASMVPRSHSRATTRAVRMVAMMVMTMASAPGSRARRLSISGLYQKRWSRSMGGPADTGCPVGLRAARRRWCHWA
jgi:hypothetical protein